ncbi:MAG: hypothetical protein ACOX3R_13890 [Desulfitobacteriia bacterium]
MKNNLVEKDERTIFVENTSYKFGYRFVTFALLFDILYRSISFNDACWDLFGIIICSGLIVSIYQYRQKILGKSWLRTFLLTFISAALIAGIIAITIKFL